MLAVILGLLGTELGLRAWYLGSLGLPPYSEVHYLRVPHPLKGWDLKPNAEAVLVDAAYTSTVSVNSHGLRDVEHEPGAAPRRYRVVVLGDSFMDAYQLPLEQTFPRLLQQELDAQAVEVVNLGVGGYGLTQSYLTLREKGLVYEPDLVLLVMSPLNDVRNSSAVLQKRVSGERHIQFLLRPYADLREDGRVEIVPPSPAATAQARAAREQLEHAKRPVLWRHSLAFRLLLARLPGQETIPNLNPLIDYYPLLVSETLPGVADLTGKVWDHAERITGRLLVEIASVAHDNGAQFGVVFIPERVQVDRQFSARVMHGVSAAHIDAKRPNRSLAGFAATQQIWLMDLLPVFLAEPNQAALYLGATDPHWSAAGHRLAATTVARDIAQRVRGAGTGGALVSGHP
jgi:hypothetical protein